MEETDITLITRCGCQKTFTSRIFWPPHPIYRVAISNMGPMNIPSHLAPQPQHFVREFELKEMHKQNALRSTALYLEKAPS